MDSSIDSNIMPYKENRTKKRIATDIRKKSNNIYLATERENKKILKFELNSNEKLYGYKKVVYNKQSDEWKVRIKNKVKVWDYIYDSSGNLVKKVEAHYLSKFIDNRGNHYFIKTEDTGVVIRKHEFVRVK